MKDSDNIVYNVAHQASWSGPAGLQPICSRAFAYPNLVGHASITAADNCRKACSLWSKRLASQAVGQPAEATPYLSYW